MMNQLSDSDVIRGTYGIYGTAVRYLPKVGKYVAWGTVGPTMGETGLQEKGRFCMVSRKNPEQALKRIREILDSWNLGHKPTSNSN